MSDNLIPITIWLSNRGYRIRIKPEEESTIRQAAKLADDKINELRSNYAGKDDQDFIAMCLLAYAIDISTDTTKDPVINQEINNIIARLDEVLLPESGI